MIGLLKPGVSLDQATAEFTTLAKRFAAAYPDTNKQFNTGQVEPLIKTFTPRPAARHAADDARLLRRRAADRLRQRDEHAVRARDAARQGTGDPLVARRDARPAHPADAHREPARRRHRRRRSASRLAYASTDWLQATVQSLENPPPAYITFDVDGDRARGHGRRDDRRRGRSRACCRRGCRRAPTPTRCCATAAAATPAAASTLISRGLVVFQIVVTCILLIGSLLQVRSILNQQTIDYGYDTNGILSARMGLMDGDYPTPEARRALLRPAAARR